MARSATRLNRQAEIFPVALRGLGIFQTSPPAGVRIDAGNGAHYLQYSGLPRLKVLNGFIQSLVGLYDFAALTGDPTALSLFESGDLAGREEVPTFDTGAWSLYSRGSITRESDLGYHKLLRDFLVELCRRTAAAEYCGAQQHFTTYLTTPPTVEVLPRTLRPNRIREAALQALEDRARVAARHAREHDRGDHQPRRARPRHEVARLDGAEALRRLRAHGDRDGPGRQRRQRRPVR